MLCQKCNKKTATVHVTKIVNGNKVEYHFCDECAKKNEDFEFNNSFNISNFLTELLDSIQDSHIQFDYDNEIKCDSCKMTYKKFKELGRLGCGNCYKTFEDKLKTLIKRIQGSEKHKGKIPKRFGGQIRIKNEIASFKEKLNEAIKTEAFENAAIYRDKIKELEKTFNEEA